MDDPIKQAVLEQLAKTYLTTNGGDAINTTRLAQAMGHAYGVGLGWGLHHHPRYTRIDIEGQRNHYAILTRKPHARWIDVELLTPNLEIRSAVPVDNPMEQAVAAQMIYGELEGQAVPSDIERDRYLQPFRHLYSHRQK